MASTVETKPTEVNTKTKIFSVAAHLFAEKGYNGVSMREISEQSGVSKPTIYYYFGSKEGIYQELVNTGLSHISIEIEKVHSLDMPIKEKLVLLLKRFFQYSLKYPEFVKFFITLSEASKNFSFLEKSKDEADKRSEILVQMIQQGVNTGEFGASAKPELAAAIYGSVLWFFIWRQLLSKEQMLTDQLAEDIIEMLFKGLNE